MAKSLASINFKLLANIKDFSSKLQNAERGLKRFGKKMKKTGQNMTRNLTAPLVGLGIGAAKVAADFESSFSKIENLVGISGGEVEKFKKSVLNLSGKTAKSPKELADALFFVTSAGLRGSDALEALEVSAKASAIGMGETAVVADAVTSVMNSYGSEVMSAGKATDILTGLVRAGKVEAEEIAPVIGKVVATASQMGISFEEVAASMATFTKLGVPAAEAATGLRAIMNSIIKPTDQSKEALKSIGLTFDDLRKKIRGEGLANTLIFLTKAFEGNLEGLGTLIPKSKALGAVMATAGAQGETYKEILNDISNSTGIVDEGFTKVSETASFKFKQAMADLIAVGIQIGNILLPPLIAGLNKLKEWTTAFMNLSSGTKQVIVIIAGLVAVIGPLLSLIGSMSLGLAALIPVFFKVGKAFKTLTITIASNPIGALLVGLSLLAGWWLTTRDNNRAANAELDNTAAKAKTAADRLAEINKELNNSGKTRFGLLREELEGNLKPLVKRAKEVVEELSEVEKQQSETWTIENLRKIGKLSTEYSKLREEAIKYKKSLNLLTKKEEEQATALNDSTEAVKGLLPSYSQLVGIDFNIQSNSFEGIENTPLLPSYSQSVGIDFGGYEGVGEVFDGLEGQLQKGTSAITNFFDKWGQSINMVGNIFGQMIENKMQRLDNYHAKERERIEMSTMSEEAKADALNALDEEVAAKKAKLQTKQAKLQKKAAIISATINGAMAVAATLGQTGFLGIPLAAIVAALVATQVGLIAAQPIPEFASGGLVFGPTVGLMGEYSGARNNPEVIAPLDKLKSLIGLGDANRSETFIANTRISGNDIVIAYEKTKRRQERM